MSKPEVLYKIHSKEGNGSVRILADGSLEVSGDTAFIGQGDTVIINHIPAHIRACVAQSTGADNG